MYMMYVDESGDPGKLNVFGSKHYILSGLIISTDDWAESLIRLKTLRQIIKENYKLLLKTELHAAELIRINKIQDYRKITKTNRINILKDSVKEIPRMFPNSKIINICLRKEEFEWLEEFQTLAWSRLIQRYDTFLKRMCKDKGIIISDDTNYPLISRLLRKMRIYNPVTSHYTKEPYQTPTDNIIEDIFTRKSENSYFIQTVDLIAHTLYRKEFPKGSLKKFGLDKLFNNLEPVLLKEASKNDDFGIVRK